jgi:Family of unknown function (DUF6152)
VKGKFLTAFALVLAISIVSLPLLAHHGNAAYDDTRTVTLKGTVTEWDWSNPHCVLQLDVTDDSGQAVSWIVETENPTSMTNIGWTKAAMKPGDHVTVTALPAKNGKHIGRIVDVLLPSGQKLIGKARLGLNDSSNK